ncbi:AraC family transcriptional regulator [Hymenobacter terrenus]|uniref:AraC family transcriptional regulator n=1 Tax=Hymenobacter terrenus TaxID=1629124 RepID=UPI0006195AEF|nr:AraC family transcriptional regulator [Hymenobacter terrenus]
MKDIFPYYSIGHFINEPDNPTAFEIVRFEDLTEPDVEDLHKHTFYEVIWTETGVSKQVIDYQEYIIAPQSLFFISPGQLHQFEEWQHVTGGSIFFTEDFFLLHQQNHDALFELSFLDNFYGRPFVQPDAGSYREIRQTIDLLLAEHRRPDQAPRIAQALLHVLLAQIQRCVDAETPQLVSKKYLLLYKRFKLLVDAHFNEPFTVSDYADRLHITQHHLNHVVKLVTGRTASEVLRARLVLEAKRLLSFTDQNATEIAAQLGVFDSSYFAKLFRAETGVSPSTFRRQHLR